MNTGISKFDGRYKRRKVQQILEWEDFTTNIIALYQEGQSGCEISEYIYRETEILISPRSIQRVVAKAGETRELGDAFRNAMKRGRVVWQLELDKKRRAKARQLHRGLRFKILTRDKFRCVLCGVEGSSGGLLTVDHVIAKCNGGGDEPTNLRTLCTDCNYGKRMAEKEGVVAGSFKSGVVKR